MTSFQKTLFFSCPISEGQDASVAFLNSLPGFENKEKLSKQSHTKTFRYIVSSASIFNQSLLKDSSGIRLTCREFENEVKHPQAIMGLYCFKSAKIRDKVYDQILHFLHDSLHLKPTEKPSSNPQVDHKYKLPCGSVLLITLLHHTTNEGIRLQWLQSNEKENAELDEFVKRLLETPDTVVIGGASFYLTTNLQKSHKPSPPDQGVKTNFIYTLFTDVPNLPDSSVYIDKIWMINSQKDIWTPVKSDIKYNQRTNFQDVLTIALDEGPLWGAEIYVDVIVRVNDTNGKQYLLRAPHQLIDWIEE